VWSARVRPDGARIVTAGSEGGVRVWDAASGALIETLEPRGAMSADFSPDGHRVAVAPGGKQATVWDADTGAKLTTIPLLEKPSDVAFSPDGTRVFIGATDTAGVWDAAGGGLVLDLSRDRLAVQTTQWSPDSRMLLIASKYRIGALWDARTGAPLHTLEGHTGWVTDAQFSADSALVATASLDGTARVWETASGNLVGTLAAAPGWAEGAAFSPDGTRLAVAGPGNVIHVWDVHRDQHTAAELDALAAVVAGSPEDRLAGR
jgi:WD40 repeat protein